MSVEATDVTIRPSPRFAAPNAIDALLRRPLGPRLYVIAGVASLVVAVVSLRFPSTPTWDPWAWVIWGRQIFHLDLDTTGGPTWKPLPMIFTTLFAPAGRAAPDMWLVVARTGGIMAVAMTFALAFRLARGLGDLVALPLRAVGGRTGRIVSAAPALVAGALAAVGLLVLPLYVNDVALGDSEGLLVAFALLAISRHLDGARRQAFGFGFLAALDRPEVWVFLGVYAVYLWRRDPGARTQIVAMLGLLLPLWFLPELWGSGSLLRGVQYARYVPGSAASTNCPFCREITHHAWPLVLTPFKIGALIVLAGGAVRAARSVRDRRAGGLASARARFTGYAALLTVCGLGVTLFLEEAVFTQAGFSGNDRYLILAGALVIVAASVGWVYAVTWLGRRLSNVVGSAVGLAVALALLVTAFVALSPRRGSRLVSVHPTIAALRYQAELRRDLPRAIEAAGGTKQLVACGPIATNPAEAPLAAWTFGVKLAGTENLVGDVLIQTRSTGTAPLEPEIPPHRRYRVAAVVRTVRILTDCRPGSGSAL